MEHLAKDLGGHGADKVYLCESPLLKDYTTDAYTKVVADAVQAYKPEIMLFGASNIGRDLAPRCAARLHTGLCADCTHLDVDVAKYVEFLRESSTLDVDGTNWDMANRDLKMTRPAFGGHLMATIICPRFRPAMATVRPGVMKKNAYDEAKANAVEIIHPEVTLGEADLHTRVREIVKETRKLVDLTGADVVVSVGRGISSNIEKGIKLAHELAEVLGGVVGSSRPVVDNGWMTADHQVGQTGKTVHPRSTLPWDLRRHSAPGRYAGFRAHHRREQEFRRSHLPGGRLRHLRRPVQGGSRDDRVFQGRQGRGLRRAE